MPKKKHAGGRPQRLTKKQIQEIVKDFEEYIETEEDPIIVGFTSNYPVLRDQKKKKFYLNKDYMNDHPEFSDLRKVAIEKQESYLACGATKGDLSSAMSIFRLKQPYHGYRDRIESDNINYNQNVDIPYDSLFGSAISEVSEEEE